MSEAELHILRSRMYQGLLNKARRGEVFNHPPSGYVKRPGGAFALDPDEQVQSVIRLIFEQFERLGTLHGLLRYLVEHGIRMPIRPHAGPNRGQLEWRRPNRVTLQNLLHHPIYAGFYRWGHRATDPRRQVPGRARAARCARPRTAWSCWKGGAQPTSRRSAFGPTSSAWRPTAPAPPAWVRRGTARRCWAACSSAAGAGAGCWSTTPTAAAACAIAARAA